MQTLHKIIGQGVGKMSDTFTTTFSSLFVSANIESLNFLFVQYIYIYTVLIIFKPLKGNFVSYMYLANICC